MTRGAPLSLLALVACADLLGISDYEVTNNQPSGSGGSAAGAGDPGGSDPGGGSVGGAGGVGPGGAGPGGNGGAATGGSGGANPCSPANYAEAILCDEPLAYFPFDGSLENFGPVGGPAVKTSDFDAGYGSSAEVIGDGLQLVDGQRLEIQGDPTGQLQFAENQPHTIEAWTLASYGTSGAIIMLGTWTGTEGWAAFNFIEPSEVYEYKRNEAPNILVCSDCEINEGVYNHLVSTYDGAVARVYVNGVLASTAELPVALIPGSAVSISGPNGSDSTVVFNEVALYDYELSAAQILLHFNYAKGVVPFDTN